jgi:hypothetical protein
LGKIVDGTLWRPNLEECAIAKIYFQLERLQELPTENLPSSKANNLGRIKKLDSLLNIVQGLETHNFGEKQTEI